MFVLTPEETAVFELLDPSSSRRLVIGRTGRAFVWDPTTSTREVPLQAAQSLVKAGVVGADGRIAAAHVALWRQPRAPAAAKKPQRPAPVMPVMRQPAAPPMNLGFEKTLPLGVSASSLQAL